VSTPGRTRHSLPASAPSVPVVAPRLARSNQALARSCSRSITPRSTRPAAAPPPTAPEAFASGSRVLPQRQHSPVARKPAVPRARQNNYSGKAPVVPELRANTRSALQFQKLTCDVLRSWGSFARARCVARNFASMLGRRITQGARCLLLAQVVSSWVREVSSGRAMRASRRVAVERREVERLTAELAAMTAEAEFAAMRGWQRSDEAEVVKAMAQNKREFPDSLMSEERDPIAAMDAVALQAPRSLRDFAELLYLDKAGSKGTLEAAESEAGADTEAEAEAEPLPESRGDVESPGSLDRYEQFLSGHEVAERRDDRPAKAQHRVDGPSLVNGGADELQGRVEAMIAELQRPLPPRPAACPALNVLAVARSVAPGEERLTAPLPPRMAPPHVDAFVADRSGPASQLRPTPCRGQDSNAAPRALSPRQTIDHSDSPPTAAPTTSFRAAAFPGRALLRRLGGRKSGARRKGVLDSSSDSDVE